MREFIDPTKETVFISYAWGNSSVERVHAIAENHIQGIGLHKIWLDKNGGISKGDSQTV